MRFFRPVHTSCFLFVVLLLAGCGEPSLQVEGTVTYDGVAIDSGSISFEPADGKGRDFGGTIKDGKFRFTSPPGVPAGKKIVRITAMRKTGNKVPAGPPSPPNLMVDEIVPIPKDFNETSKLFSELNRGKVNQLEYKLSSSPP